MGKIKSTTLNRYNLIIEDIHSEELEVQGTRLNYTEFDKSGNTEG